MNSIKNFFKNLFKKNNNNDNDNNLINNTSNNNNNLINNTSNSGNKSLIKYNKKNIHNSNSENINNNSISNYDMNNYKIDTNTNYQFLYEIFNNYDNKSLISSIIKICFHPDFKYFILYLLIHSNLFELKFI
jgi:hypothetical protein